MKHQTKKDLQLFATKLTKKIPDNEHCQSFKRKKKKSVKQSKTITQQPKTFKNAKKNFTYIIQNYKAKNFPK